MFMPLFNRQGKGQNKGQTQGGRGRMGGGKAAGPGGVCVCVNPDCDYKQPHERGQACYKLKCPECGSPLKRK